MPFSYNRWMVRFPNYPHNQTQPYPNGHDSIPAGFHHLQPNNIKRDDFNLFLPSRVPSFYRKKSRTRSSETATFASRSRSPTRVHDLGSGRRSRMPVFHFLPSIVFTPVKKGGYFFSQRKPSGKGPVKESKCEKVGPQSRGSIASARNVGSKIGVYSLHLARCESPSRTPYFFLTNISAIDRRFSHSILSTRTSFFEKKFINLTWNKR